eukprot:Skav234303  [mRNA]  locus=scaffold1018:169776:171090:+ [translate_table: standard]
MVRQPMVHQWPPPEVKLIDFGVAKSLSGTIARSCVGTTEIMAPELVSAKCLGPSLWGWVAWRVTLEGHHRQGEKEMSPGFGIVTQRPDGKGAMVNGIEAGGTGRGCVGSGAQWWVW